MKRKISTTTVIDRRNALTTAELLILSASYYQSYAGSESEIIAGIDSGKVIRLRQNLSYKEIWSKLLKLLKLINAQI